MTFSDILGLHSSDIAQESSPSSTATGLSAARRLMESKRAKREIEETSFKEEMYATDVFSSGYACVCPYRSMQVCPTCEH
jgi:hypothetical protein